MRSIAVIGLGRFGAALARELQNRDIEVLAIDGREQEVQELQGLVTEAVRVDAQNARELERLGLAHMDVVVVAIGEDFEAAQDCVLALKSIGVRHVVARAQTRDRRRILRKIGADSVVSPEAESAKRVAQTLTHPLVSESVDLGEDVELATLAAPQTFVGKNLGEIRPNAEYGVLVVRISKTLASGEHQLVMPPGAATVIEAGDQVTVVGKSIDVNRFASS